MNTDRLLAHYEKFADAPDAIPRLRHFILDLAVRGKLVEQDPRDEPASELLKRIAVEKARMVKTGEIRKPRDLSGGGDLPVPFEIPTCWCWVRLDEVGAIMGAVRHQPGTPTTSPTPGRVFHGSLRPISVDSRSLSSLMVLETFLKRGFRVPQRT